MILLIFMVTTTVIAEQTQPKPKEEQKPTYTEKLFQHENVYIGPQPKYDDFATIKAAGITSVINMRTPKEIDKLDFYEDYLLKKAGIDYHMIPIGSGEFKYSPAKLEEFAQLMEANQGKVLLHCGSGHRASQLWAAYLVKYKGKSPDEALAMVKDMGWWPMPMELLLNKKLHVTIAD